MTDRTNQKNQNIDWTRKGFGWVPDYPDIRDFFPLPSTNSNIPGLQKEIQKDGVTDAIDDLTKYLVEAIRLLLPENNSQDGNFNKLQETLETLENRSDSGVRFNSTRVYRVLSESITNQNPYDKEQQQEILQLKKCLYFLVEVKFLSESNGTGAFFKESTDKIKWLTDPKFDNEDSITKSLVKQFQQKFNLRDDGIVGINTLLTLERCLSYRVLSKETEDDSLNRNSGIKDQLKEIRQKEIRQLKQGLYILIQNGIIDNEYKGTLSDNSSAVDSKRLPRKPTTKKQWNEWITNPIFDDYTESLVKQFQKTLSLPVDGAVRYDTFLRLKKSIANPERCKQNLPDQPSAELQNPATLAVISSLVPDQIFGELVDALYSKWSKSLESRESLASSNALIATDDLIKVLNKENKGVGPQEVGIFNETLGKKLKEKNIKITRDQLIESCKGGFLIIDPIISVILMILSSPLASQRSFRGVVLDGMEKFTNLLEGKGEDQYLNQIAKTALFTAKRTLNVEKSELVSEIAEIIKSIGDNPDKHKDKYDKLFCKLYPLLVYYSLFSDLVLAWETITWIHEATHLIKGELDKERSKEIAGLLIRYLRRELSEEEAFKDLQDFEREAIKQLEESVEKIEASIEGEFDKKEHFKLTLAEEKTGEEDYFKLLPTQTTLSEPHNPGKPAHATSNSEATTSQDKPPLLRPNFFDRPEIVLPISSSASRLKGTGCGQKEPYFLLPGAVDLSYWCSPVEDQGTLNTCTACAGIGLLEYFAKRTFGEFEDLSSLFLYKAARDLRQRFGDVGAPLRDVMRAMILFGVAPERYWPYQPENLDVDPPALCYSYAQNYQTLKYFRLDRADLSARNLLLKVKAVLSAGFPCMFGFTAYTSIYDEENISKGYIPFPDRNRDRVVGGHAVVAVGYNDYQRVPAPNETESFGALLVRNSWGREWGLGGYGWLPYDYVLKGLTGDWWSLLKAEWFGQGYFGLEARNPGGPGGPGSSQVTTTFP